MLLKSERIYAMRYKKGDLVRIRTWKDMEKEYGLDANGEIFLGSCYFTKTREIEINKISSDRIVEISEVCSDYYFMKNRGYEYGWRDGMIEGLASELEIIDNSDKILSRFEILDI